MEVLVPVIFVIIWAVAQALGAKNEVPNQQAANQRRPVAPGGRKELQDFLRELGVEQSTAEQEAARQEAERRAARARARRQTEVVETEEQRQARERLREHHLRSELERRRQEELQSSVAQRAQELSQLAGEMERRGTPHGEPMERSAVAGISTYAGDPVLQAMFANRELLARAYVLGQVLGPPPGMQD